MVPDVGVHEVQSTPKRGKRDAGAAIAERPSRTQSPAIMRAFISAEFRETFLEIRESRPPQRLVTAIEVLSPSNKQPESPGWKQYVRKRESMLLGRANFVEIDLLRGGRRMPMEDEWPEGSYYLLVARKEEAPNCSVWPAYFQYALPEIPVPLAPPDRDIRLSLQPLIEAVYTRSRYETSIDYRQPLRPNPSEEEAAWLKVRLPGRKRRKNGI
jgi:hypothetical protein